LQQQQQQQPQQQHSQSFRQTAEDPDTHRVGRDAALLDAAKDEIWRIVDGAAAYHGLKNVTSRGCLLIVKDGALVYEKYNSTGLNQHEPAPESWSINSTQPGWSMTKTLGAMLAGWAVTHGHLDLDKDITAAYGVPSPKGYPVTARQIMSQSLAGDHSPGEAWRYDATGQGWINHMASVVRAATGRNASRIWREELQTPLGLSDAFVWGGKAAFGGGVDANPDNVWAYGSVGTCRDYARVMQLALNKVNCDTAPTACLHVQRTHSQQHGG
jgi:CubicO group peptidase (beta-lactamase class C family)